MKKLLTIIKAIWTVIWTNRDLIEKHLTLIKSELAARKGAGADSSAGAEQPGETVTPAKYRIIDTYEDSMNM